MQTKVVREWVKIEPTSHPATQRKTSQCASREQAHESAQSISVRHEIEESRTHTKTGPESPKGTWNSTPAPIFSKLMSAHPPGRQNPDRFRPILPQSIGTSQRPSAHPRPLPQRYRKFVLVAYIMNLGQYSVASSGVERIPNQPAWMHYSWRKLHKKKKILIKKFFINDRRGPFFRRASAKLTRQILPSIAGLGTMVYVQSVLGCCWLRYQFVIVFPARGRHVIMGKMPFQHRQCCAMSTFVGNGANKFWWGLYAGSARILESCQHLMRCRTKSDD